MKKPFSFEELRKCREAREGWYESCVRCPRDEAVPDAGAALVCSWEGQKTWRKRILAACVALLGI